MRIAILGATGKVGSGLISFLEDRANCTIIPVVRSKRDASSKLARICDLRNPHQISATLEGIDVVINLTGRVTGTQYEDFYIDNFICTANLFKACNEIGIKRLFHISSVLAKTHPESNYGKSKRLTDEYLLAQEATTVSVTIIRSSWIMPTDRSSLLKTYISYIRFSPILIVPRTGVFQPLADVSLFEMIYDEIEATVDKPGHQLLVATGISTVTLKEFFECLCTVLDKKRYVIEIPISFINYLLQILNKVYPGARLDTEKLLIQKDNRTLRVDAAEATSRIGTLPQELAKVVAYLM